MGMQPRHDDEGNTLGADQALIKLEMAEAGLVANFPIPPEDGYVEDDKHHDVTRARGFKDLQLSNAAAGFVSFRPITMLMRRWIFQSFIAVCAVYFSVYCAWYSLGIQKIEVEGPFDLTWLAVAAFGVPAVSFWMAPVSACLGQARLGVLFIGGGMLFNGILATYIWVFVAIMEGQYRLGVYSSIIVFIEVSEALTFAFKENWVWRVSLFDSILAVFTGGVLLLGYGHLPAVFIIFAGSMWLVMCGFFIAWRAWSLREARLATKPDQARYDTVWEPVKGSKAEQLRELAEFVNARKHERVLQPFATLELIFKRGHSINKWYQDVVAMWAQACGARSMRAPVKSLQRTLEKVHRSYKGRVTPVIDIVRSTMIVDDIDHMQKVLEYVVGRCIVHQIKNRFDLNYDGNLTCGYRDLNMQLTFKELNGTVFEGFVFELQMHYAPILALKDDNGHARYIKLRNLRGD